jgi:hypothetical protein
MTLPDHIGVSVRCASLRAVGATRLSLAIACSMALAFVPVAAGATGDLAVSVSRLKVPTKIRIGSPASFAVRYVVRGPATRRANAMVQLTLQSPSNRYRIESNPARVYPAIWSWSVTDTLPGSIAKGPYKIIVQVTLQRNGKVVAQTRRSTNATVS